METFAQADSAAVVEALNGAARPIVMLLLSKLQGLDPAAAEWITRMLLAGVSTVWVASWRWVAVSVERSTPGAPVVAIWNKVRPILNPLLAALAGAVTVGDALGAVLPIVLHVFYRGGAKVIGNATPQGVSRSARSAGAVALVLAGLALAGPAVAESKLGLAVTRTDERLGGFLDRDRWAFTVAAGARANGWIYSRGKQGFAEVQVSWQWTNAVGVRVGARRTAVSGAPWEPEAKVTMTYAP